MKMIATGVLGVGVLWWLAILARELIFHRDEGWCGCCQSYVPMHSDHYCRGAGEFD